MSIRKISKKNRDTVSVFSPRNFPDRRILHTLLVRLEHLSGVPLYIKEKAQPL
jgi:hypothetical protein